MKASSLLILLLSTALLTAPTYELDLERGSQLQDSPPKVPPPSRVNVYVSGQQKGITKTRYNALMQQSPAATLTNGVDAVDLMNVLRVGDNQRRITNVSKRQGWTYDLLLFYEAEKTVLHVKVFQPSDLVDNWCYVFPQSSVGSIYFSNVIKSWLQKHVTPPQGKRGGETSGLGEK